MKNKLTTLCSKNNLGIIRQFISEQLADTPIAAELKHNITLAVDEAAANAIIHGNQCNDSKNIEVEMEISSSKITIEISDIGSNNFDAEQSINKEMEEIVKEKRKGGMGLKLIHSIMDEVIYHKNNNKYFCLLIKNI